MGAHHCAAVDLAAAQALVHVGDLVEREALDVGVDAPGTGELEHLEQLDRASG